MSQCADLCSGNRRTHRRKFQPSFIVTGSLVFATTTNTTTTTSTTTSKTRIVLLLYGRRTLSASRMKSIYLCMFVCCNLYCSVLVMSQLRCHSDVSCTPYMDMSVVSSSPYMGTSPFMETVPHVHIWAVVW